MRKKTWRIGGAVGVRVPLAPPLDAERLDGGGRAGAGRGRGGRRGRCRWRRWGARPARPAARRTRWWGGRRASRRPARRRGAPRSDQPTMRLPRSRPDQPHPHGADAAHAVGVDGEARRLPCLGRVRHGDLVDRHCHGPEPTLVPMVDVVVVGAGPNGLAAAITCAEAGRSVLVLEATERIGGGTADRRAHAARASTTTCAPPSTRSPRCRRSSPQAGLERHGLELLHPEVALAHPLDDGRAGVLHRSVDRHRRGPRAPTAGRGAATSAGRPGAGTTLAPAVLGPLAPDPAPPVRDGRLRRSAALLPATRSRSGRSPPRRRRACSPGARRTRSSRSTRPFTTAMGIMLLASAHVAGWPVAARRLAGDRRRRWRVACRSSAARSRRADRSARSPTSPTSRAVLFDVTPRQLLAICGDALPASLPPPDGRFRYGPAVFKVDYAPVGAGAVDATRPAAGPARSTSAARSRRSPRGEAEVAAGRVPDRPVRARRRSRASSTRHARPAGKHTLWTYCHVPNGSDVDMTDAIERQIERFAPGFRDVVLARHVAGAGLVRGPQREPRRRRHRRRLRRRPAARCCGPGPGCRPTRRRTPGSGVLAVDAPRRRRPRHVRPRTRPVRPCAPPARVALGYDASV